MQTPPIDTDHERVERAEALGFVADSSDGLLGCLRKHLPKPMRAVLVKRFERQSQVAVLLGRGHNWNFRAMSRAMASSMPR